MHSSIAIKGGLLALVDEQDIPMVSSFKWHSLKTGGTCYARCQAKDIKGTFRTALMHRMILSASGSQQVDHINGNGLDNRRCNLRLATPQENSRNRRSRGSSGYVGVKRSSGLWVATICPSEVEIYLGKYEDPAMAAAAYNTAAVRVYGRFARLNDVQTTGLELDEILKSKAERIARLQDEIQILGALRYAHQ